ncbi:LUD domain-containing protein, partial [Anaerobiospirillum sp. NML120448]|uniref:LUD domain-containing protein n=1 Tax=Anaerobiospirillum sp. NML120448 TaxID=2932816 RepID=UPI001FF2975F
MDLASIPHKTIVSQKLNDGQMRENLTKAMHTLQGNRLNLIENKFDNWQGLRDRARQVKNNALMSLQERIEEFEKNATKNGIQVHFASTDKDACEIIYQIMKDNNVDKVLKG